MTIKQLIESLSKIEDQEIKVMVRGYEGGVNDIVIGNGIDNDTPAIVNVALNVNDKWYYGAHETVQHICAQDLHKYKYNIVKAIVL